MGHILQLPLRRPLVSVEMAKAALDRTEDQILELVESGKLRFAFRLEADGTRRRLVRIFALSLADYANGTNHQPSALQSVVNYLLPGSADAMPASRLARTFGVGGTHLSNLIRQRSLVKVSAGRYAKASPMISRASAVKFLTLRRLA